MQLQELDLAATYGPNSPGVHERRLVGKTGKMNFGADLWKTGRKALDVLEGALKDPSDYAGPQQWSDSLPSLAKKCEVFLDEDFFPSLCQLHDEGLMTCDGIKEAWPKYDYPAKVELMTRAMEPFRLVLPEEDFSALDIPVMAASAIIFRLDDALIADFCFGNGLDSVLLEISELVRHLNIESSNKEAIHAAMLAKAKKELASAGAAGRHAENRALKQDVFDWLDANPPKPRGKDAAAAAIAGGVVPVAFRTARKWIDEWENLPSTGTV